MRTTIDIPDSLIKKAKKKAIEEGISLKQLFTEMLEKELAASSPPVAAPWKELQGMGSADKLRPDDSGFEGNSGPDWNHSLQVNQPEINGPAGYAYLAVVAFGRWRFNETGAYRARAAG